MKITFTIREGMITRVRYKGMPDMTDTILTGPRDISDAVARVANAPVGGRIVPLAHDSKDQDS